MLTQAFRAFVTIFVQADMYTTTNCSQNTHTQLVILKNPPSCNPHQPAARPLRSQSCRLGLDLPLSQLPRWYLPLVVMREANQASPTSSLQKSPKIGRPFHLSCNQVQLELL